MHSQQHPPPIVTEHGLPESLSSYVQRLTAWHNTTPGQLLHRLTAHAAADDHRLIGRWRRRTGTVRLPDNINGFAHAMAWVQTLEKTTQLSNLTDLTTTPWDQHFSTYQFLHRTLHWCPLCLAEDKIPYHRLSWTLRPVTRCSVHQIALHNKCPTCGNLPHVVDVRSSILQCPKCGKSLLSSCAKPPTLEADSSELFTARQIDDFLRQTHRCRSNLNPLSGELLREICEQVGVFKISTLARIIGSTKTTVWGWWHNQNAPSFSTALRIAQGLRIDLYSAMAGNVKRQLNQGESGHQLTLSISVRKPSADHDWPAIRRLLKTESRRPLPQAKTLADISRELGPDVRTLRQHEPELCRQIGSNSRRRKKHEAENRQNALKADISIAIQTCRKNGIGVNERTIAEVLHRPGLFSRPNARRALAEVLIDGDHSWPKFVTFPSLFKSVKLETPK